MAFEDPDGSVQRSLLSIKQLYILGTRARVTRWKDNKHNPHMTPMPTLAIPPSTPGRSPPVAPTTCSKHQLCYVPAYSRFKHKTMRSSCAFKWTQIQVICVFWICF